jgi:hypothetical protein
VAAFLRFGLEPASWLFYEASHALKIDFLYWGYSAFRGAAHGLSIWSYGNVFTLLVGLVVALWVVWRGSRAV